MKTKLTWYGKDVLSKIGNATIEGLRDGGEFLKAESVNEAPIDSSALRQSAEVTDNDKDTVHVSYDAPGYTIPQHENMGFIHLNGGKAKFLEDPANQNADTIGQIIAESLKNELGGNQP